MKINMFWGIKFLILVIAIFCFNNCSNSLNNDDMVNSDLIFNEAKFISERSAWNKVFCVA
jgi:hypothetical protein